MNKSLERLYNGIFRENPTNSFCPGAVSMCPTLAVTTSVVNAIGMNLHNSRFDVFKFNYFSLFSSSKWRNIIPDRFEVTPRL